MVLHIKPDCFSLKDEMVLLRTVTFRERFMSTHTNTSLKGSLGMEGGKKAPCELLRYEQVNDFLFTLRLFPHSSLCPRPWRDGLELQFLC